MSEENNSKPEDTFKIVSSYQLRDEMEEVDEPDVSILSDLPSLNRAIEGFQPGELIAISGPTKHGKTLFAQTLTDSFCKQNYFPLWFSYEVAPKYFLRGFTPLPLFYMPRNLKGNNLKFVTEKMVESKKLYGTVPVFIDHLHYLFDLDHATKPSIQIGSVIRTLKRTAVVNDLIVFILCHTVKGASEKDLTASSIRDSSFVGQESDCVIMISRNTKQVQSCEAMLMVEYHRRTGSFKCPIHVKKVGKYLREIEED